MTNEELDLWARKILSKDENKILLKRNDLDGFYDKMYNDWGNGHFPDFTRFFLSRGVNPLPYFKRKIPDWCFSKLKIGENNITLKEGITTIGYGAFYNCIDLKEITLPRSLIETSSSVFKNCKNLRKVTFKSIPKLKGPIFSGNSALTDIYLPKPTNDYETTRTNWVINHMFKNDMDIDKINIHYI